MKRKVAGSVVLLLLVILIFSACSSRMYSFNGKKSKNCGCPTHRGIVG